VLCSSRDAHAAGVAKFQGWVCRARLLWGAVQAAGCVTSRALAVVQAVAAASAATAAAVPRAQQWALGCYMLSHG
jgi:hypothetical protein